MSSPRAWSLSLLLPVDVDEEALAAVLVSCGAEGWFSEETAKGARVIAGFPDGEDPMEAMREALTHSGIEVLSLNSERVERDEWVLRQREEIRPFAVTERITIVPTRYDYEPREDEMILRLDGGMAFGTGRHETTRSCLQLIERNITPGETVLDVGCGTGILALAAARLGAERVCGVDNDPEAVRVCRENASFNTVQGEWAAGDLARDPSLFPGPFSMILANIISWTLSVQMPFILSRLAPDGKLITAGVLASEREKMAELWNAHRMIVQDEIVDGEWLTQLLVREPAS